MIRTNNIYSTNFPIIIAAINTILNYLKARISYYMIHNTVLMSCLQKLVFFLHQKKPKTNKQTKKDSLFIIFK